MIRTDEFFTEVVLMRLYVTILSNSHHNQFLIGNVMKCNESQLLYTSLWKMCMRCLMLLDYGFLCEGLGSDFP